MSRDIVAEMRERTGLPVAGAFAFGDSPELSDELLGFVRRGTKRATAGSVEELLAEAEPFPEPGLHWVLLDGRGEPHYVMQTVEVTTGRVDSVTPAFAWDEGEYDRTRESWLEGHRRYFRRQGAEEPDALQVAFERFRIVWPEPDRVVELAPGVRELRWDEHDWAGEVVTQQHGSPAVRAGDEEWDARDLPGLVVERAGDRAGLLTFRPRPDGVVDVASVAVLSDGHTSAEALAAGLRTLGQRNGWRDVRGLPGDLNG